MRRELISSIVIALALGAGLNADESVGKDDIVVIGASPPAVAPVRPAPEPSSPVGVHVLEAPERAPAPAVGVAPIGAIVAWAKSMPHTPSLPGAWVECNGQEIKDPSSPYDGQVVPNLNSVNGDMRRFLRGSTQSGATGGSEDHYHGADRSQKYGDSRKPVGGLLRESHLPPYYEVVWVIRIK